MFRVEMFCYGKGYGVLIENLKTAFDVYYMLVNVCINHADDWQVYLIDLKEYRFINSCDSEFMGSYYDEISCHDE